MTTDDPDDWEYAYTSTLQPTPNSDLAIRLFHKMGKKLP